MNDNKSRDIFYGVVAIATLIVALVGATLAYFSITASSKEGAVNAHADTVSITYNDGQQVTAAADKLIPSSLEVVQKAYERSKENFGSEDALNSNICLDDNGRQVCSIYRFSISSDSEREMIATLNNETNEFNTGLSYAVYDVDGEYATDSLRWQTLDDAQSSKKITLNYCNNSDVNPINYCYTTTDGVKKYNSTKNASNSIFGYSAAGEMKTKTIGANKTQTYDLVIFLNESGKDQNEDQGKKYQGTIVVKVIDSGSSTGQITGTING